MSSSKQHPHQEERNQSPQGRMLSESRFLALAQESADVFWLLTPASEMSEVSSSWHIFTGQEEHESLGRGWLAALHPADQQQIEEMLLQAATSAHTEERECRLRRCDGIYRLLRLRAIPVREPFGAMHEVVVCGNDLTGQELNGQKSEAQVQLDVNISGVGVWDWDCLTNQLLWTDREKALFGWPPDAPVTHERFLEAVHPDDRKHVDRISACRLAGQRERHTDYRVIWPDGSIHWLSDRVCSITDARGKVVHLVGATVDITDGKQAEERITAILESITDAFIHLDREWCCTYINRRAEEYAGRSREELLGKQRLDLFPGFVGTLFEHRYREAMETQQEIQFEAFNSTSQKWFEVHIYPTQDGLTISLHDITKHKQAEEALRQSRDALRLLTEAIPQLVWIARSNGAGEYGNQQWYDYTGSNIQQMRGDSWISCYHPDDHQKLLALWDVSLRASQPFEVEARVRQGKTGAYRWFLVRAVPLTDASGRVWKWVGTATDIHEKKCTEEALRESEERFRRLVASNILGIIVFDLEGNIREANDAFLALVGYTREDLAAGRVQWAAMTPPEYQARDAQAIEETLTTGCAQPFEKAYVTKDGRWVPVLIGGTLFRREGPSQLVIGFVVDLTARKELEQQKDLMLGLTGHELKTPLAALRGTLQLVQRRMKRVLVTADHLSPEMRTFFDGLTKSVEDSVRQIDVQTRLINDLLDVSRITANTLHLSLHHCELGGIVRQTVEDLRVTTPERSLLLELPEYTTAHVLVDGDRISQVVTNYVTNALRYSGPNQPVHIGLTIQSTVARVWVRDTGPGLTEEAQKELWQRFHQVKEVSVQSGSGKGLGLGLYICQTLIAQHQGEVGVESTPGEGSIFWFTLPLVKRG